METENKAEKSALDREEQLTIVHRASESVDLSLNDRVLDINCGDGTLLGWYTAGIKTVGVEEDVELMKTALNSKKVDVGVPGKFTASAVREMCVKFGMEPRFKIITAIDALPEHPESLSFLNDCRELLQDDGVLIVQSPHRLNQSSGFLLRGLREDVAQSRLVIQGIELFKKAVFRAYITYPSFKKFFLSDQDMKLRLYFVFTTTIIQEMRQPLYIKGEGKNADV